MLFMKKVLGVALINLCTDIKCVNGYYLDIDESSIVYMKNGKKEIIGKAENLESFSTFENTLILAFEDGRKIKLTDKGPIEVN